MTQALYAQARQYLPRTGQFMSADPLHGYVRRPATINRYSYCCQQPLDFVDPLGLSRQEAVDYAKKWAADDVDGRNPSYPSYDQNCTNFVSQALAAGGVRPAGNRYEWYCDSVQTTANLSLLPLSMLTAEIITGMSRMAGVDAHPIHDERGDLYVASSTWGAAQNHYDYFSNPENGFMSGQAKVVLPVEVVGEDRVEEQLLDYSDEVEKGDIAYWGYYDSDGHFVAAHTTIVTDVRGGQIYIASNDDAYSKRLIFERMCNGNSGSAVVIVHLRDECFGE